MAFTYEHPRPMVTVDVVWLCAAGPSVLLIRRARPPFAGRWALPGGYLDLDEELEAAARRELLEETSVRAGALHEIGAFGKIGRDPRGRTISVAFLAVHAGEPPAPRSGDDAGDARWQPLSRLPPLGFDHGRIVAAARMRLRELAERPARLCALLPARFTLAELGAVHALATGRPRAPQSLAAGLRRSGLLQPTGRRRGREQLFRLARGR